jgi:sn-glycerol 3-phosphate transport system substrate-binding protein
MGVMRRSTIGVALLALVALLLAACGGGGGSKGGSTSGGANGDLPKCPLDALASAQKPVEITYWHAMTRVNEEQLKKLASQFNARQRDVHVTISGVPSYSDNLTRFKAGLGTGNLPDLIQSEETSLQTLIDSRAILPVQSCLTADHATTDDFVKRIAAYYTVKGVLQAMPFNDSNPVLYYDRALFERAGLDPDKPPATLDDVKAAAQQIVQKRVAPSGIALKADTVAFEHWLGKSGHTIVDNDNGRAARATKVTFDDATGEQLFAWIDDMTTSKLAISTTPGGVDHFLAVANGRSAMTIDSSAALGTIDQVLGSGQFKAVKLGVGPMPGPNSPEGGVLVGGAANYIVNKSSPAKQAAAYQFAKFLAEPQVQADWAAATGYVPVRTSSTKLAPLSTVWAQKPGYKVAYDQLLEGPENPATAGPVIGPYGAKGQGVRGAIIDALTRMLTENLPPADAIKDAAKNANAAIAEYNSRVG